MEYLSKHGFFKILKKKDNKKNYKKIKPNILFGFL